MWSSYELTVDTAPIILPDHPAILTTISKVRQQISVGNSSSWKAKVPPKQEDNKMGCTTILHGWSLPHPLSPHRNHPVCLHPFLFNSFLFRAPSGVSYLPLPVLSVSSPLKDFLHYLCECVCVCVSLLTSNGHLNPKSCVKLIKKCWNPPVANATLGMHNLPTLNIITINITCSLK